MTADVDEPIRDDGPDVRTAFVRFFVRDDSSFAIGRDVFLRLLGVVAFAAGWSLASQVEALYGANGILPFVEYLEWVDGVAAGDWGARIVRAPTILWWFQSDAALVACAWTSAAAGLALALGVAPRLTIPVIWLSYASVMGVGRVFLSFQWDILLLETLVVAWFLAPWNLLMRWNRPNRLGSGFVGHIAARFLLFKLMWLAGWVKLASGDPTWAGLEALEFHLWTQPLPAWTAYWAHHLPSFVLAGLTFLTLAIELVAPWLLFGPRRVRHFAILLLVLLQVGIGLVGSFGFFNLLTVALCLAAVDDEMWRRLPLFRKVDIEAVVSPEGWCRWAYWALLALLLSASSVGLFARMSPSSVGWIPHKVRLAIQTSRSFNGYGLFARMTTDRREIGIELSEDGAEWHPVRFRYKPNGPDDRPGFVVLHMPRLDWQMWFAGLGSCDRNSWLVFTGRELLDGNPEVAALFEEVPALDEPRFMRFPSAQYRFGEEAWWTATDAGPYCPTLEYLNGGFRAVD